jgi:Uma2 family endonuclease
MSSPGSELRVRPLKRAEYDRLVEVADSWRRKDRLLKREVYARNREPADDQYRRLVTYAEPDTISPAAFPDVHVAVAALLPPVTA